MDGHPVNGTPIVTSTLDSVMVTTSRVIYVIDPSSGLDRWEYHPDSCTISAAVLGPAGALIAQTCVHPDCSQVRQGLCGDGPQLLLRDAQQGRDGDNRKTGRNTDGKDIDQIIWNDIGNDDLPVAAGPVVAALNRTTRALDIFDQARGRPTATAILAPVPATLDGAVATVTTVNALVRLGAAVHALDARGTQIWTVAASGPATVTPVSDVQWPAEPASSRVTVVAGSTVLSVDARTGAVRNRSTLPHAVPTGTLAYPLGTGYLAIGRAGVVAYR
jgi:outer membrane protein assembly factor BamB